MKAEQQAIAYRFGILDDCISLEHDLLKIDGITSVDFDLCGWHDNIRQIIFLANYDTNIDFDMKHKMLLTILDTCKQHHLTPSGDITEDYGNAYYVVRNYK